MGARKLRMKNRGFDWHRSTWNSYRFRDHRNRRLRLCRNILDHVHRRDEAITSSWLGLDEARIFGGIAQRVAKLVNCCIQTVIEVNERVCWPKTLLQFFASNDLACALQQEYKNLERLFLELYLAAIAREFASANIRFIDAEAISLRRPSLRI